MRIRSVTMALREQSRRRANEVGRESFDFVAFRHRGLYGLQIWSRVRCGHGTTRREGMKIFLDTAEIEEIRTAAKWACSTA